jgi:5-(carboxyamino)imidazole ribonucleotide mutase
MPSGVPVATFAIGKAGAVNAALFAAQLLAVSDPALRDQVLAFRKAQTEKILADDDLQLP